MAKIAFKIMLYTFLISVATSMLTYAFPIQPDNHDAQNAYNTLNQSMGNINPSPPTNALTALSSFFDFFTLGMWSKIQGFMNATIFSFTTLFVNLGVLDPNLAFILNGTILMIYISGLVSLFSKNFNQVSDDY